MTRKSGIKKEEAKYRARVHVRAIRTRITGPDGIKRLYTSGHIFKKPWPELIDMARKDTRHHVLRLEIIKEEEDSLNDQ